MLSVIKVILIVAAVILTTANRTYAAHSGAECYLHGHRIYVPDGLNYPRQAWAGWEITCRTATPEIAAGAGAIGADPEERPAEWCGWWIQLGFAGAWVTPSGISTQGSFSAHQICRLGATQLGSSSVPALMNAIAPYAGPWL